jgi:hypothetical protein
MIEAESPQKKKGHTYTPNLPSAKKVSLKNWAMEKHRQNISGGSLAD